MNYNATDSGIFFDTFPEHQVNNAGTGLNFLGWTTVNVPSSESGSHSIECGFQPVRRREVGKKFMMETSLPALGAVANQLTSEADFGDNLTGWEYRTQ